jgi:hypothetical protein
MRPVEDMVVNLGDLIQRRHPVWYDPIGVIMRSGAHGTEDITGQGTTRAGTRCQPADMFRSPRDGAVASERKLATRRSLCSLVDDPANSLRILGKGNTVKHHLDYGLLSPKIVTRLVERRRSETLYRLLVRSWRASEVEWPGSDETAADERNGCVERLRLLHGEPQRNRGCNLEPVVARHQPDGDYAYQKSDRRDGRTQLTAQTLCSCYPSSTAQRHARQLVANGVRRQSGVGLAGSKRWKGEWQVTGSQMRLRALPPGDNVVG